MVQSFQFTNEGFVKYYYEVEICIHAFGINEAYDHLEVFNDYDLSMSRTKAIKFYNENCIGIEKNGYFLPIAAPDKFVEGKNSCYSISLSLVQECNGEKEFFTIIGEVDEENDACDFERETFNKLFIDSEI